MRPMECVRLYVDAAKRGKGTFASFDYQLSTVNYSV
jgi:hypothetical protein